MGEMDGISETFLVVVPGMRRSVRMMPPASSLASSEHPSGSTC